MGSIGFDVAGIFKLHFRLVCNQGHHRVPRALSASLPALTMSHRHLQEFLRSNTRLVEQMCISHHLNHMASINFDSSDASFVRRNGRTAPSGSSQLHSASVRQLMYTRRLGATL